MVVILQMKDSGLLLQFDVFSLELIKLPKIAGPIVALKSWRNCIGRESLVLEKQRNTGGF